MATTLFIRIELGNTATFVAAAILILLSVIGTVAVARCWTSHGARLQYMVALGVLKGMTTVLLQPWPSMDRRWSTRRKKELSN